MVSPRPGPRAALRLVALLAMAMSLAACDRAVEPYVPGETPQEPDLARIFPEGAERALQREQAAAPQAPMGGRGAPPVAPAGGSGAALTGTVRVAPELVGSLPSDAVLFLIARRGDGGPPLAAKRIQSPRFPVEFRIGPEDRMIEAMPFSGPLRLTARVDADGNATSRSPGDLQGAAPGLYEPGASGVVIEIDERL